MAKNDNRNLPAIPYQKVANPPQSLPVQSAHEWINDQTEEKAAESTQQAKLGAYAGELNTAMTVSNADSTVRGMNAMEAMREQQGGSPRHQQRVGNVLSVFQEDLVDANRRINAVASENITQAINKPFQKPKPKPKEPGFWGKFFGDTEEH
jgi:hypothetical protein